MQAILQALRDSKALAKVPLADEQRIAEAIARDPGRFKVGVTEGTKLQPFMGRAKEARVLSELRTKLQEGVEAVAREEGVDAASLPVREMDTTELLNTRNWLARSSTSRANPLRSQFGPVDADGIKLMIADDIEQVLRGPNAKTALTELESKFLRYDRILDAMTRKSVGGKGGTVAGTFALVRRDIPSAIAAPVLYEAMASVINSNIFQSIKGTIARPLARALLSGVPEQILQVLQPYLAAAPGAVARENQRSQRRNAR